MKRRSWSSGGTGGVHRCIPRRRSRLAHRCLVERYPTPGRGSGLNVGCIPSKALLHAAAVIDGAVEMAAHGVEFGPPSIDPARLAGWKNKIVARLTRGLTGLAKQRKVEVGPCSAPARSRRPTA